MPLGQAGTDQLPKTRLLILCPPLRAAEVRLAVTKQTYVGWEETGRIIVLSIEEGRCRDKVYITDRINKYASLERGILHVLALDPIRFDERRFRGDIGIRKIKKTVKGITDEPLSEMITLLELDLLSVTFRRLSGVWEHGDIDRNRIETWLSMFRKAGNHQWIGENLLRVLSFWPSTHVVRAFNLPQLTSGGFSHVSVSGETLGSSSSTLATRIKKQLDALSGSIPSLEMLRNCLADPDAVRILYLEDSLITGTEMRRIFQGLLGKQVAGESVKALPLDDPSVLLEKELWLKFAVVTNWGVTNLRKYLEEEGLLNIHLDMSDTHTLNVLTSSGVRSLEEGTLLDGDGCIAEPERDVVRMAFENLDVWGSFQRRERAVAFCQEIGKQLFQHYTQHHGKHYNERWVEEAGLGVQGLALALAFSHSIPKSTLPLFWMHGKVTYAGNTFDWIPLFPSAL